MKARGRIFCSIISISLFALGSFAALAGCAQKPMPQPEKAPVQTVQPAPPVPAAEPAPAPAVQTPPPAAEKKPAFNPNSISAAQKEAAITDIRAFILSLNKIIKDKNYNAWVSSLTDEYREYYSDPSVLAKISDSPVLKKMGIKINSLYDYFIYVVYPSRQNDHVDDIDYVDEDQVRAITISTKGERQILYNLEKQGNTWKIGIGR